MNDEPKVFATEIVACYQEQRHGVPAQAVVIVFEDGRVKVSCVNKLQCTICLYEVTKVS